MKESVVRLPKKLQRVQIIRGTGVWEAEPAHFQDFNEPLVPNEQAINEQKRRLQREKEVKDAYDRGFEDGRDVTTGMFEREMQRHEAWVRNFDTIIDEGQQQYVLAIRSLEESAVQLAVAIAEQILAREISQDASVVIAQVRRAFDKVQGLDSVRVRVHPDNLEALEAVKSRLVSQSNGIRSVELVSDENIARGGCIVDTELGMIDAQIHTQLEGILKEMMNVASAEAEDEHLDMSLYQ